MKAFALVLIGAVLAGGFINEKLSKPVHATDEKTEIVYGTRIGPGDQLMLVTK